MRRAPRIKLSENEQSQLENTVRSSTAPAGLVSRARIILAAAKNLENRTIAASVGLSVNSVGKWRARFAQSRWRGLADAQRPGRRALYGREKTDEIVLKTLGEKPKDRTHWSTRSMATAVGVSNGTVAKIWRAHRLQPHLERTFKLSTDKQFTLKLHDIIGLYLAPPDNALVLSVDEKSQIQALDRTQPGLPLRRGRNGTKTHDYKRHGTCCLFAALNVLTGTVLARCERRHRHQEYLRFLSYIDQSTPHHLDLHLIVDNYSTHKHAKVQSWLAKHPRFRVHFTPTSSSWLNMVERFFGLITQDRIRRGVFKSVLELILAIESYIETHNTHPKPFVWTKTPAEIIAKLKPAYIVLNKTMN